MFVFQDFDYLTDGEIDVTIFEKFPGNKKKGYVPSYKYSIMLHGQKIVIGRIDIRIGYNENLLYGGHLGFEIIKKYRGNGYAAKAANLLKRVAIAHGMNELTITCNPKNIPSRKTCENLGATLKELVLIPPTHELYERGERLACIYVLPLSPS